MAAHTRPAPGVTAPRAQSIEIWAGVAVLAMSVGVASPVLLGLIPPLVPYPVWVAVLALFLAALLFASMARPGARRSAAYAVAMLASWALVLTLPTVGFVLVLLVVVAGLGAYVAPLWASLTVVALNTVVVALTTALVHVDAVETAIQTGFYLMIQLATLLSSIALLQERATRRELAAAHVALRAATLERAESARTAERLRISRDLHDALGHQLTVLTLQLETAKHVDPPDARHHVERADELARTLLRDVRQTVMQLRLEAPDLELALRDMTAELPGLEVTIAVEPGVAVDDVERAALLRAAQEVVTNTIRHAEATELHLRVHADELGTTLTGRDNGQGVAVVRPGNGLRGLRERFEALGGEVALDGSDGFVVTARLAGAAGQGGAQGSGAQAAGAREGAP
ncbi:histidine kinase [Agrococcus sp. 1P02AA]|uniref:sensor histidine kinase n=1 Tax=Agrococcus sp. 1P02AA TaxID=3132259 RepID=UPI0039A64EEC